MGISKIRPMDWHVLQVVHRLGSTPQHKLAEHIGRQRSTVNGAVQRLLASGWLTRVGQAAHGRGRPAILLSVDRAVGCFAGVDIAANELHCAVVGADGDLIDHASSRLSDDRSFEAVLDQIDLTIRGLLSRVDMGVDKLLGLWAGINGAVDDRGTVVSCASLGWHNAPLGQALEERYGGNILVQGGMTVMHAAAESLMGVGRDAESLAYYHVGRGIGVRFVRRGQPLSGHTLRAGELGHVVVEPNGPRCPCGNNGCLEAMAAGPAIVSAIRKISRRDLPEPLRELVRDYKNQPHPTIVHAAFLHGSASKDDALGQVLNRATQYLAMGAAMTVAAYDPEVLVLGGYVLDDNPVIRKAVRRILRRTVLDWADRDLRIVRGEVITQGRAVGGAAEVCQRFWANPRGVVNVP